MNANDKKQKETRVWEAWQKDQETAERKAEEMREKDPQHKKYMIVSVTRKGDKYYIYVVEYVD